MQKKINLQKIIDDLGNFNRDEDGNLYYYAWEIKNMMKEACRQTLKLAAKNAKLGNTEKGVYSVLEVSKQSILDTINLIE